MEAGKCKHGKDWEQDCAQCGRVVCNHIVGHRRAAGGVSLVHAAASADPESLTRFAYCPDCGVKL